jgi:hypothetical protein
MAPYIPGTANTGKMKRKRKQRTQGILFSDEQMAAMKILPAKDPEPAPAVPISPGIIATQALLDCLADVGYTGSDPVYDFLTKKPPNKRQK